MTYCYFSKITLPLAGFDSPSLRPVIPVRRPDPFQELAEPLHSRPRLEMQKLSFALFKA